MKRLLIGLCTVLIAGFLSASAQSASESNRFLLLERELRDEFEGGRGIVATQYLLKFDTATGHTWRYVLSNPDDPTEQTPCFIPIPLEGTAIDGKEPGRFRLVVRTGGYPDVLILDGVTGRVWVYRGVRHKDRVKVLKENFVLVNDVNPQR